MAIVTKLLKVYIQNNSKAKTTLHYSFDYNGFSIKTYKANDVDGKGTASQNILLNKDFALQLRDALNHYLEEM